MGLKLTKGKHKIVKWEGFDKEDLIRRFPASEGLSEKEKEKLDSMTDEVVNEFIPKARTNFDIVDYIKNKIDDVGFDQDEKNYMMTNADDTAFALVRTGKKSDSLRIISTHTDMPHLVVTKKPLLLRLADVFRDLNVGLRLSVRDYGHILPHQWFGREVNIRGWVVKEGKKRIIEISGYIPEVSLHVDKRQYEDRKYEEAFPLESLQVVTGHNGPIEFLDSINFDDEDDFGTARLFVIPQIEPRRLVNHYITGYGFDDSICNYAAVNAILNVKNPEHTSIVIGFDNEESFGVGGGSADSNFFDDVLYQVISDTMGIPEEQITVGLVRKILKESYGVGADVTVGPTHMEENDREDLVDPNAPKMGYGVTVSALTIGDYSNYVSPDYVDWMVSTLQNGGMKKGSYQLVGNITPPNDLEGLGTQSLFLSRKGLDDIIDLSVPVSGLHCVSSLLNVSDVYRAQQAYEIFLKS